MENYYLLIIKLLLLKLLIIKILLFILIHSLFAWP